METEFDDSSGRVFPFAGFLNTQKIAASVDPQIPIASGGSRPSKRLLRVLAKAVTRMPRMLPRTHQEDIGNA
jgi:hypothetical protein